MELSIYFSRLLCDISYFGFQILPAKIKGLGGSVATLANWFFCWVITITAPLLLAWSTGGLCTILRLFGYSYLFFRFKTDDNW